MPLYLLRAKEGVGYDSFDGFVISAKNEIEARHVAQINGADEIASWEGHYRNSKSIPFWDDEEYSSCEELYPNWMPGIVLSSFNAG